MKCVICGKDTGTTDRRIHYCSEECRRQGLRMQMVKANKKRRNDDPNYRRKSTKRALERYYERKHERFALIAKDLSKVCGDIDAMASILEETCRLRH